MNGAGGYRPYPAYKDSGVEWLGEVPEHWVVSKLGHRGRIHTGGTPSGMSEDAFDQDGIVWIKPEDLMGDLGVSSPKRRLRSLEAKSIGIVREGTVFVCGIGTVGKYGFANEPSCTNQQINSVVFDGTIIDRFGVFLISCLEQEFIANSNKVTIAICNKSRMGQLFLPVPSLPEQRAIADFLDRKTAEIDALIAAKERLIALLREKRAALITQAVTKGLDPDVPLKDSGVEWLGEVPEHWEVKRVKRVAKMESGHTPRRSIEEYWENCEIPWVSLNDTKYLAEHDYIDDTAQRISALGMQNSSAHLLPARAVLFTRDATIGLTAITTKPMAVSQHIIAWICGPDVLPEYLLRVFDTMRGELDRLTMGSTLKTIGMPDVKTLITPVPPLYEQHVIVEYINMWLGEFSHLLDRVRVAITLLQEYRTALISAAVTGKIDVRERSNI